MATDRNSRSSNPRSQAKKAVVPDWFKKPADATKYIIMEERCFVSRRNGIESTIEALDEDVTQEEFAEITRVLGQMRGYVTA